MKNDPMDLPPGTSSSLVADYLVDLLRSLSALAEAADLAQSKAAIDDALEAVLTESANSDSSTAKMRSAG